MFRCIILQFLADCPQTVNSAHNTFPAFRAKSVKIQMMILSEVATGGKEA